MAKESGRPALGRGDQWPAHWPLGLARGPKRLGRCGRTQLQTGPHGQHRRLSTIGYP